MEKTKETQKSSNKKGLQKSLNLATDKKVDKTKKSKLNVIEEAELEKEDLTLQERIDLETKNRIAELK